MSKFFYGQLVEVGGRNARITAEAHPESGHDGAIPLYEVQFEDGRIIVCQEQAIKSATSIPAEEETVTK